MSKSSKLAEKTIVTERKRKPTSFLLDAEDRENLKQIQERIQRYTAKKISEATVLKILLRRGAKISDADLLRAAKKATHLPEWADKKIDI